MHFDFGVRAGTTAAGSPLLQFGRAPQAAARQRRVPNESELPSREFGTSGIKLVWIRKRKTLRYVPQKVW